MNNPSARDPSGASSRPVWMTDHFIKNLRAEWVCFYHELFGLDVDHHNLEVPIPIETTYILLIADQAVTVEMAYSKCQELFGCKTTIHRLTESALTDERDRTRTYALWLSSSFRPISPTDSLYKTANQIRQEGINSLTLRELLLLELWCRWTRVGITNELAVGQALCAGTRLTNGRVPYCSKRLNIFGVYSCEPDFSLPKQTFVQMIV